MEGFSAIIEMPRGDTRRRHFSFEDKSLLLDLGPIPEIMGGGIMPEAYGFLEGVMNKTEGDEVDVVVFSESEYKPEDKLKIFPIGVIIRSDGDHKVLAVDESLRGKMSDLEDIPEEKMKPVVDFFGAVHPISEIKGRQEAEGYIASCLQ